MSSPSTKVVVVQHDRRAAAAVRLGFEREGLPVVESEEPDADAALVVAGAEGSEAARALLGRLAKCEAPILWVGNGVKREEAWAAGADEMLQQPAFLRDVVTIGKLLSGRKRGFRTQVSGDLGDFFGVFYLVRALAATGRSGVLTLVRGLRRGEVRFFQGEVTSAHMGGLHGQAGLHQLLLWSEARFEWRHEPVVRRRQIPLEPEELLSQAERFLGEIRDVAGGLSPAAVYEHDVQKIQAMAKKLPTEVHGVLRLFDGNRTLADVLEDSPFRVFETLRVGQRAVEVGLLRRVQTQRPKAALRAVLAVEEWLVGNEPRDAIVERTMQIPDTAPSQKMSAAVVGGKKKNRGKRAKDRERASGPRPVVVQEIDWQALVPRATNVDMSAITGVVPSSSLSGEISIDELAGALAARRDGREGLEALTDPQQRSQMFPSVTVDLGPDPEPVAAAEPEPVPEPAPAPEPAAAAEPATEPVALAEPEPEPAPDPEPAAAAIETAAAAIETAAAAVETAAPEAPVVVPEEPAPSLAPEPSPEVVVSDLAAAHAAITAIAEREQARTEPSPDTHDPATSAQISGLRKDVVAAMAEADPHFTEHEEEFFRMGHELASPKPVKVESFQDLDEGYEPVSFWDRLRGLGGKPPTKPPK